MALTQEQFLTTGKLNGVPYPKIKNALIKYNLPVISETEYKKYQPYTQAPKIDLGYVARQIKPNLKELGSGLTTTGALLSEMVINPQYRNTVGKQALNYLTTTTPQKKLEDFININTAPYNYKVGQPLKPKAILSGIANNPVTATIDLLSLGGAKALGKAGGQLSKTLRESEYISPKLKTILPSDTTKEVNKAIKFAKLSSSENVNKAEKFIDIVKQSKDIDKVALERNLRLGQQTGSQELQNATKAYRIASKLIEKEAIKQGLLDKSIANKTSIGQYIFDKLPEETKSTIKITGRDRTGIQLSDIYDAMEGKNNLKNIIPNFDKLYQEGSLLKKQGKLVNVSHRLNSTESIEQIPQSGTGYFDFGRMSGRTPIGGLADTLTESLDLTNRELGEIASVDTAIKDILSRTGKPLTNDELAKFKEAGNLDDINKVVVSPKQSKEMLKGVVQGGRYKGLDSLLSNMGKTFNTSPEELISKYGDKLYTLDKDTIHALKNSISKIDSSFLGKLNRIFKKSQLSSFKWVGEDVVGNLFNNTVSGVSADDYSKAISSVYGIKNNTVASASKKIPQELIGSTSFQGILGENTISEAGIVKSVKNAIDRTTNTKLSPLSRLEGAIDITASPVVHMDSKVELVNRYANYRKQAREFGKTIGKSEDEILIEANKNRNLRIDLLNEVDKELGDYAGRNYFVKPETNMAMQMIMPFYKFPTQTARVTFNQLKNRPAQLQALLQAPSKYGQGLNEQIRSLFPVNEDIQGGVPVTFDNTTFDNPQKFRQLNSIPQANLYKLLSGVSNMDSDTLSQLFPLAGIVNALNAKGSYGTTATSPNYIADKNGNIIDTKTGKQLKDIPIKDKQKILLSYLLNTYTSIPPQWNRTIMPITASIAGQPLYPKYDTQIFTPLNQEEANISKLPRQGVEELIGNMFGLQTVRNYPDIQLRQKDINKSIRSYNKKINRANMLKEETRNKIRNIGRR